MCFTNKRLGKLPSSKLRGRRLSADVKKNLSEMLRGF